MVVSSTPLTIQGEVIAPPQIIYNTPMVNFSIYFYCLSTLLMYLHRPFGMEHGTWWVKLDCHSPSTYGHGVWWSSTRKLTSVRVGPKSSSGVSITISTSEVSNYSAMDSINMGTEHDNYIGILVHPEYTPGSQKFHMMWADPVRWEQVLL